MVTNKVVVEAMHNMMTKGSDRWGMYFLGQQLNIGNTKLYKAKANARNIVVQYIGYYIPVGTLSHTIYPNMSWQDRAKEVEKRNKEIRGIVEEMEKTKIIEFRQLKDRSPRFPYNVPGITREEADKYVKMLDAPDKEMVTLGITILEELQKKTLNDTVLSHKGNSI